MVAVQKVESIRELCPSLEIAMDVGATEPVDRLLGIADEDKAAGLSPKRLLGVDAAQQAQLSRRSVLALVDHRHWILSPKRRGGARRRLQALDRLAEEVIEGPGPAMALDQRQPVPDPAQGMAPQDRRGLRDRIQLPDQRFDFRGPCRELIGRLRTRSRLVQVEQTLGGQTQADPLQPGAPQVDPLQPNRTALTPTANLVTPPIDRDDAIAQDVAAEQACIGLQFGVEPTADVIDTVDPMGLEARQGLRPVLSLCGNRLLQVLLRRQRRCARPSQAHSVLEDRLQSLRLCGEIRNRLHGDSVEWVHLLAPIVPDNSSQPGLIGLQQPLGCGLPHGKQVLREQALDPCIDGHHRSFVHAVGRLAQEPRRLRPLGAMGIPRSNGLQEPVLGIRRCRPLQDEMRLHEATPDSIDQLLGGRPGEGEHQNVSRPKGAQLRAVQSEHQAHVEAGDCPGLAGAGAGLDQVLAVQRQRHDIQRLGHAPPPESSFKTETTRTWRFHQSKKGP